MAVTLIERLPSHFDLKIHFPSQCNGTAKKIVYLGGLKRFGEEWGEWGGRQNYLSEIEMV